MSKHTPGPWRASGFETAASGQQRYMIRSPNGGFIAAVPVDSREDANLILQSPNMLDALRNLVRTIEPFESKLAAAFDGNATMPAVDAARAVIAKIEGADR